MALCSAVCCDAACTGGSPAPPFLIVTRPLFVEALGEFVDWKKQRGQATGVLTLEWIHETYGAEPGLLLADRLKTALRQFKSRGTQFVLLVGDAQVEQILDAAGTAPPGCHLQMNSLAEPWSVPTGYYYRNLPCDTYPGEEYTDVFFADLADWDPDGNGLNDDLDTAQWDLAAMIFVGRWPVRTPEEVIAIAGKTREVAERAARGEIPKSWVSLSDAVFGPAEVSDPTCDTDYADPANVGRWWGKWRPCNAGRLGASRALSEAGFAMTREAFAQDAATGLWPEAERFEELFYGADALLTQGFHGGSRPHRGSAPDAAVADAVRAELRRLRLRHLLGRHLLLSGLGLLQRGGPQEGAWPRRRGQPGGHLSVLQAPRGRCVGRGGVLRIEDGRPGVRRRVEEDVELLAGKRKRADPAGKRQPARRSIARLLSQPAAGDRTSFAVTCVRRSPWSRAIEPRRRNAPPF
ncbi:MAG: C25 family cysteine peptidase [Myxococcales bacterium]